MTNPGNTPMESIHHIAIQVSDIDAALAWYGERFAFETLHADASWALLQFENVALALVLPGQHPPHFAVARVDAETHGELTPHRDGTASVYVRDPWDNVIEFMKPAAGE
jgi:hypothetical protein